MWLQGFEAHVLEGGRGVLLRRRIPFILTEVGPAMMRAAGSNATDYLQQFVEVREPSSGSCLKLVLSHMTMGLIWQPWLMQQAGTPGHRSGRPPAASWPASVP